MIFPSSEIPHECTACVIVTFSEPAACVPPLFIPQAFFTPFDSSHAQIS